MLVRKSDVGIKQEEVKQGPTFASDLSDWLESVTELLVFGVKMERSMFFFFFPLLQPNAYVTHNATQALTDWGSTEVAVSTALHSVF